MRVAPLLLLLLVSCTQGPTIAAWNLQVYGDAKAADPSLIQAYADVISRYDIVVLQEIRDKDGSSIAALCARLDGYTCNASSRAGRTSSKEQYVLAYRNATLLALHDYNPDGRWERPPIRATFLLGDETIALYAIHTKPTAAAVEIEELERLVTATSGPDERVIVLGDLNADCSYYERSHDFRSWRWAIDEDTTTGASDCAYDRIITNRRYVRAGVDKDSITPVMSDHYPVWIVP